MNKKWESERTPYYLTCGSVKYYGLIDEAIFFDWLYQIDSIVRLWGYGADLYLFLKSNTIPPEDFFEILTFFKRYRINVKQLIPYMTDDVIEFFVKNKKKTLLYPLLSYKGNPPEKQVYGID